MKYYTAQSGVRQLFFRIQTDFFAQKAVRHELRRTAGDFF